MLLTVEVIVTELSARTLLSSEGSCRSSSHYMLYMTLCKEDACWPLLGQMQTPQYKMNAKIIPETNIAEVAMVIKVT